MLYWAIFTLGFMAGAVLSFLLFAAKDPEEEGNSLPGKAEHKAGNGILFEPLKAPFKYFAAVLGSKSKV